MKLTNKKRDAIAGYSFISIWIVGFIFLSAFPLLASFYYSFNKVIIDGQQGLVTTFTGFNNYVNAFTTDVEFLNALREYLVDIAVYLPLIIIISMILAILLNQKIKGRGFFRSVYFLPVIISSGPVINELLSSGTGTLSAISRSGMVENMQANLPVFLSEPIAIILSEMIVILWFSGVQIVLFLAGLQKINREIYEAAEIDGASPWESFWKITLPSLRPIILLASIYTIVTLSTFSNNTALGIIREGMFAPLPKGFGYSSALAWVYFLLVSAILGLVTVVIAKPWQNRLPKGGK